MATFQKQSPYLLWLVIFAISFLWRSQNLSAFSSFNDEGAHLMWAKLAVEDYPLYSQTSAVQSPLFLETIALAFRLFGIKIEVGRGAMLVGFGLLAVSLTWLAYQEGGWVASLVAVSLISISPLVFTFSRLVMAEVSATALAVTSLAFCVQFVKTRRILWLIASGLALGLSFISKALNPFLIVPIGFLLCNQVREKKANFRQLSNWLILWGGSVLIPVLAIFFIYDFNAIYDQLILFRNELRIAIPGSFNETITHFKRFISSHWSFCLLACVSLIPNLTTYRLTWLLWLLSGALMLLWHTPLFPHHFIVLVPALSLLASVFIADVTKLRSQPKYLALWLIPVAIASLQMPTMLKANQETINKSITGGREAQAIDFLKDVTAPQDFLMGDSQLLIFMAERRTPPPLGDVALVAIKAGRQNSKRMINLTEQYQSSAVVQWSLRLPWLPEYLTWTENNYLARRIWDNDHIIYFVPRLPPNHKIPNPQDTHFGKNISLRGYQHELNPDSSAITLRLYWHTTAELSEDYTIFTQLLDSNGILVTGWDSQPLAGHFPTREWPPNEIISDIVQMPLDDTMVGDYTLIVGLYRLDTMERLKTQDGADYLQLTTLNW